MNDINTLKSGQSVIFSASKQIFTVKNTNTENNTVFLYKGDEVSKTSIENVFSITEHTKKVSKLVTKKQSLIKVKIPFGITINKELLETEFLDHWITMCNCENNITEFKKAKEKFNTFVITFNQAIYLLENINVGRIPLLEQIF